MRIEKNVVGVYYEMIRWDSARLKSLLVELSMHVQQLQLHLNSLESSHVVVWLADSHRVSVSNFYTFLDLCYSHSLFHCRNSIL